jgi:hypothetical protein
MHSEIFRSLSEALARHLPHLRTAQSELRAAP